MHFAKQLQERKRHLAVLGLGYVGLPLAVRFFEHFSVLGLDQNEEKIASYRDGHDVTEEVGDEALGRASIRYTSDTGLFHHRSGTDTRTCGQDAGPRASGLGQPQCWPLSAERQCRRL